jgi:hypothetical protein
MIVAAPENPKIRGRSRSVLKSRSILPDGRRTHRADKNGTSRAALPTRKPAKRAELPQEAQ